LFLRTKEKVMSLLTKSNSSLANGDLMASLENFRKEFNNLFGERDFPTFSSSFFPASQNTFFPAADLSETETGYNVEMEIPGMTSSDVTVELKNNTLFVQGEKKTESEKKEKGVLRKERTHGSFYRALPFAQNVDPEKVSAKMKDGVLKIEVEKLPSKAQNGRKITISE